MLFVLLSKPLVLLRFPRMASEQRNRHMVSSPLSLDHNQRMGAAPQAQDGPPQRIIAGQGRPIDGEHKVIQKSVDMGAVDGTTGERKYYVDGFTTEENGELLARLHAVVEGTG